MIIGLIAAAMLNASVAQAASVRVPGHLIVGDQTRPLDVTGTPQFGWLARDAAGNEVQTAYEIVVRNGLTGAEVWDSGRVQSSRSAYVPYGGPQLTGGTRYDWTVVTWNRQGQQSPAAGSRFDVGISDNEWAGAQWIRRPTTGNDTTIDYTLARRQFRLSDTSSPVVRALAYVAAPMRWQLHVNGAVIDTQDDYQTAGENYYDAEDITSEASAAQRAPGASAGGLAVGVLYGHWAVGEAHPEGPQPYATTLAGAVTAGSTSITVDTSAASTCQSAPSRSAAFCGAGYDWYVGEQLGLGTVGSPGFTTDAITAINGNTVTLARPLPVAQADGAPVTSENGPSGLLVKVVVDYANGRSDTFTSDGSWEVTKDTAEQNAVATMRSTQGAGDYVESYSDPGAQSLAGWDGVGYAHSSAWQPAVVMGTAPLPEPPDCGDYSVPAGADHSPDPPATATATPVLSAPCGFTHLEPLQAPLSYKVIHPASVETLPDGTVEADFGLAFIGVPVVRFPGSGAPEAGRQVALSTSYRLAGTITTAPVSAGATSITVNASSSYPDFAATGTSAGFAPGDPITIDAPADGYGAGHPESDTITSINGGTIGLARPLTGSHAAGVWVQGARVGTDALDTQSTNLSFNDTESGTPGETTGFYVPMGWRYLQVDAGTAANGGRPLTAQDIWAVEQYNSASQVGTGAGDPGTSSAGPDIPGNVSGYVDSPSQWSPASVFGDAPTSGVDEAATFTSSNPKLNAVFTLMERSALYAGQQAYEDSPDRQEGQFTGDALNESLAQMEDLHERGLTRELIDNLIHSQQRWWISGSPAPGSTWGEVNAIYPDNNVSNGNKRDIPDYSEMFPELVWDYYLATGDEATLRAAYPTMENVARYVSDSTSSVGQASGLVCQLASFSSSSSYQFGIIDWPQTDRYNTVVLNSGVDTIVNERAVEDFRALAGAAGVVGDTAGAHADAQRTQSLTAAINSKLRTAGGLYADGMSVAGGSQGVPGDCGATAGDALIDNISQLDQSFAIVYGVAPPAAYPKLGSYVAAQGMKQGPMDVGQLELALVQADRPRALVRLLTNTAGDGPAKILAEGGTSMWEQWDPGCNAPGGQAGDNDSYDDTECTGSAISQTATDSFSHGWGSVGVYPMTRGLLGITAASLGGSELSITPPRSGLASASGTEWGESGPVHVSWRRAGNRTDGQVTLQVDIPDNVRATIALPTGRARYAADGDGMPRYEGIRGGRVLYSVGSGTTFFHPRPGPGSRMRAVRRSPRHGRGTR
jgi:hypothetical protein